MIQKNLFDLTPEQEATSKMLYEGKIIKCLVAPYHSYDKLGEMLTYSPTTYLFPEREISLSQITGFIMAIVKTRKIDEEIRIITANQNIIMDMADDCVRVLTEGGDIVPSPTKTFMANIHTIRYELLENKAHQLSEKEKNEGVNKVNLLIKNIKDAIEKGTTKEDYDLMFIRIKLIGEPIIRTKLSSMMSEVKIL
jgi:hypothetical protein